VRVEIAEAATPELLAGMQRLIPQLSRSNPPPTLGQLHELITSTACDLFLAYDDRGRLVGTATLAVFRIPTALRGWIEDVLTSRPSREDANRLYQKLGFEQRDTNVYRKVT
jgi:hypothetical protein